ncbi:hypothetical protein WAK64_17915 [Bacillus spongiae]|uniref:Transmembrane protein n=1 Tax=Bacillus spongiae TaxID=2683610 RepID=A0ABU8HHQ9_9BACI
MNNWVNTFFNMWKRQNLFNMIGRRRNNKGILWASLFGIGISAVALGLRRNGNRNRITPLQTLMNNFQFRNNGQMPKMANSLMEFSKEVVPNKIPFNK